jgi:hypothetical protein
LKKFLEIIGIDQEKKLTIQERCKIFAEGRVSGRMGGKHNYSVSSIRRQSAYCLKNMKKSNNVLRWKGWVVNVIIFYVRSDGKYF